MSASADAPRAAVASIEGEPTAREIRAVLWGLIIILALGSIDQSIVSTALPRIVSELGGITDLSWVVTAYVLASTATMPLYGKLSDQYGRKPILYAAILIFLAGSALSGLAQSLPQLIVFRAIQGLGAGGLLPLAQIIIGDLVPPAKRGRQQGKIVAVFAVCSVLGPVVGGIITDLLSWHWIFYLNLPIGAVGLVGISRALRRRHPTRQRRIDYLGAGLLTTVTTAVLLVLAMGGTTWPWTSPQLGGTALMAFALGALFIRHLLRTPEPVLPPALFRDRLFSVACIVLALTMMGMLGSALFFPLFFQFVLGISPSHAGLLTGPLMIGVVTSSLLNGRVLLRSGRYKPAQVAGLSMAVISFGILAWAVATAQCLFVIEPATIGVGLGLGLVMPNMTIAVQNALPREHRGVGTSTLAFFRSLGGLIGVTGAGAVLTHQLHPLLGGTGVPMSQSHAIGEGVPPLVGLSAEAHAALLPVYRHAIATAFASGACIIAAALIVLFFLPELPLERHHAPARTQAARD